MIEHDQDSTRKFNFDIGDGCLESFDPMGEALVLGLDPKWLDLLRIFWRSELGLRLAEFIKARINSGARIYPKDVYRALQLTPFDEVSIVILGQDPYHGPGQAHGLSFSVPKGVKTPPSLANIFKELVRDPLIEGFHTPESGNLEAWAQKGVLLLNTTLTVEQGAPASHSGQGWEVLTDLLINALAEQDRPIVFMLWGAHAQSKEQGIRRAKGWNELQKLVLSSNHPSPLSALRGKTPFIGNGHFSSAKNWLSKHGIDRSWAV